MYKLVDIELFIGSIFCIRFTEVFLFIKRRLRIRQYNGNSNKIMVSKFSCHAEHLNHCKV